MLFARLIAFIISLYLSCGMAFAAPATNIVTTDIRQTILDTLNTNPKNKINLDSKLSDMAQRLSYTDTAPDEAAAALFDLYDPQFRILRMETKTPEILSDPNLYRELGDSNTVGISVRDAGKYYKITIIGVKRHGDITISQRPYEPDWLYIQGKWFNPYSTPWHIEVSGPDGDSKIKIVSTRNKNFNVPIRVDKPGKYNFRVYAITSSGFVLCATIPYYRDTKAGAASDSSYSDADAWFNLINSERVQHNLPKLVLSKKISLIAAEHSEYMGKYKVVYHTPAGMRDTAMEEAGIDYTRLGENVAVGDDINSIHAGLSASPEHRANILGDYTRVGLGLYKAGDRYYATQIFVK